MKLSINYNLEINFFLIFMILGEILKYKDEISNASNKLLKRSARHITFLEPPDAETCFRPPFDFETTKEDCNYVRYTEGCTHTTFIVNYLEVILCNLKIERTYWGVVQVWSFTALLMLIYLLIMYILARFFIVPNVITIAEKFHLDHFNYGSIVLTIILAAPRYLRLVFECLDYVENATVILAENVGNTLTTFVIGFFVLSLHGRYHFNHWSFFSNLFLTLFGNVYMVEIYNYRNQLQHMNEESFNVVIFGALSLIIFIIINIVKIVVVYRRKVKRMRMKAAASKKRMSRPSPVLADIESGINLSTGGSFEDLTEIPSVHISGNRQPKETFLGKILSAGRNLLDALNPFENIHNCTTFEKIIFSPFWILLAIAVPVVDRRRPLNGWCWFVASISFTVLASFSCLLKITNISMYCILIIGGGLTIANMFFTKVNDIPKYQHCYAIIGITNGFIIFEIIGTELDVLFYQILNFWNDWKYDAIVLLGYQIGHIMLIFVFCLTLIKSGHPVIAYGLVIGISLFCSFMTFPFITLTPCFFKDSPVVISAPTITAYYFIIIIISMTFWAISFTNFHLRRSHGAFCLLMYIVFAIHLILSVEWYIHPYGHQHALVLFKEPKSAQWA